LAAGLVAGVNGQRQLQPGHGHIELWEPKFEIALNTHKMMGWVISIYRTVIALCTARFSIRKTGNVYIQVIMTSVRLSIVDVVKL
jgi:hypothetical protein